MQERRVSCDEGLLVWDGRVLELFATSGKDQAWRVHAATVINWDLEQRRGVVLLRVWPHKKQYRSALIASQDEPLVRQIMGEVDATT